MGLPYEAAAAAAVLPRGGRRTGDTEVARPTTPPTFLRR